MPDPSDVRCYIIESKGKQMLLHHHFVHVAKQYGKKPFLIDCTADKTVSYSKALTISLILAEKFRKHEKGFIGIAAGSGRSRVPREGTNPGLKGFCQLREILL